MSFLGSAPSIPAPPPPPPPPPNPPVMASGTVQDAGAAARAAAAAAAGGGFAGTDKSGSQGAPTPVKAGKALFGQ